MDINFRYTKHQVARGTRPDAEILEGYLLIKPVSELRATYQIRLLAYRSIEKGKKLIIEVPKHCKVHPSLQDLVRVCGRTLVIRRD